MKLTNAQKPVHEFWSNFEEIILTWTDNTANTQCIFDF